jgi:microcystin-dependent protein
MTQPFVGQILAVGFKFAPAGWFLCDGSLKPIAKYETLYDLIGTTYGGDGVNTFAVPDLRGRTPLHFGTGQGLSPYIQGQQLGSEQVTLLGNHTAAHNHGLIGSANNATATTPAAGMALATATATQVSVYATTTPLPATSALSAGSIGNTPAPVPHENRQSYLVVNYIIAHVGVFPNRN